MRTSNRTGVMFLSEVALGKEHTITEDQSSLKKAPSGFDSVVARGRVEPGTVVTGLISDSKMYLFMQVHFNKLECLSIVLFLVIQFNKCSFILAFVF